MLFRSNFSNTLSNLKILPYLLPSFHPRKTVQIQTPKKKEVKIRFGNLNYRSIIGALPYVSCCTRPDITYAVKKLAKFSNNPGTTHFRALLHLIGYIKKKLK